MKWARNGLYEKFRANQYDTANPPERARAAAVDHSTNDIFAVRGQQHASKVTTTKAGCWARVGVGRRPVPRPFRARSGSKWTPPPTMSGSPIDVITAPERPGGEVRKDQPAHGPDGRPPSRAGFNDPSGKNIQLRGVSTPTARRPPLSLQLGADAEEDQHDSLRQGNSPHRRAPPGRDGDGQWSKGTRYWYKLSPKNANGRPSEGGPKTVPRSVRPDPRRLPRCRSTPTACDSTATSTPTAATPPYHWE